MILIEGRNEQLYGGNPSDPQDIDSEILYTQESMIIPIEKFEVPNNRIDRLRKFIEVGAPIASPVFVIPHESFLDYKQKPEQTMAQLEKELKAPAQQAMANSKKHSIALRRAYEVPELTDPPGPRYLGVTDKTIAEHIKKLWDFAIKEGYDNVEGSQIACFFYPFTDPENKPLEEIKRGDILPYGGQVNYVSPYELEILATWGNHQTVIAYERQGKPCGKA